MSEYTVPNFRLGGYATGNYSCICGVCGKEFIGDKRARVCLPCTIEGVNQLQSQLARYKEAFEYEFDLRRKHEAELEALKAISLDSKLSWQDRHIAAFKILNPEVLEEGNTECGT